MRIDLTEHVAVVTGAGSGIGRAIATDLANAGAKVALADIDVEGAEVSVDAIAKSGGTAKGFLVDVTSRHSIQDLSAAIGEEFGPPDIIVNCAGWNAGQPFLDNPPDFIDKVAALNFMGPILMCQEFLRSLVTEGRSGRVANIASDAGRVGSLGESVYAGAKGGVIAFTKSLAREMARHHINVNCVAPGPTETPLFEAQPEKIREALIRAIPFRRLGQPEEIAHAVTFLVSDQASYITGQVISVNGGLTMVG